MALIDRHNLVIYIGRNSPRKEIINLNGAPIDFVTTALVTKMGIVINGVEYSSADGYVSYADGGIVEFFLGSIPNPPAGRHVGRLVIYSAQYPLGRPLITEKTKTQFIFEFV